MNFFKQIFQFFKGQKLAKPLTKNIPTPEALLMLDLIKILKEIPPASMNKENLILLEGIIKDFKHITYKAELMNEFGGFPPKIRRAD